VFEHLRAEFPQLEVGYLLNLYLSQIYLLLEDIFPAFKGKVSRKLELLDEKHLTAFLRTTSSVLQIFKMSIQCWVPALAQMLVAICQ